MNTVINLSGREWKTEDGRRASFSSAAPAWGIMDSEARLLTKDGLMASVWSTKTIALEVAPHADGFPKHRFTLEVLPS